MKTKILPVTFWPDQATEIEFQAGQFGPPPWYGYTLKNQAGTIFKRAALQMPAADWNSWPADANDTEYQLNALTAALGLTRAFSS
jgi:hypothetical protein